MESLHIAATSTLLDVDAAAWDALVGADNPFVEHAFLLGLEKTGCVGGNSGWQPLYLTVRNADSLVAALPLYVKGDSMGEFIFDWGWANFYHQQGHPYYPKLVVSVPFTPATGPRALTHPASDGEALTRVLADALQKIARQIGCHSVHWLFVEPDLAQQLRTLGWLERHTTQSRWLNENYANFEAFLATMKARNRKQIRRERRDANGHGLKLSLLRGQDMGDAEWRAIRQFYVENIDRHGSETYLNEAFFAYLRQHFPHRVVCTFARDGDRYVAGTLNFIKGKHLYGRYWGCTADHAFLHFELAFYLLIEFCIDQRMTRFEAGAGGEHKLKRGMEPVVIYSAHWLANPILGEAIAQHVARERDQMALHIAEVAAHSTRRHDAETEP